MSSYEADMQRAKEIFPAEALADGGDSVQVPFTADGLKLALLNAERWVHGCTPSKSLFCWIRQMVAAVRLAPQGSFCSENVVGRPCQGLGKPR
jgi:hypothetical protein